MGRRDTSFSKLGYENGEFALGSSTTKGKTGKKYLECAKRERARCSGGDFIFSLAPHFQRRRAMTVRIRDTTAGQGRCGPFIRGVKKEERLARGRTVPIH